jgi:hypothetical protein
LVQATNRRPASWIRRPVFGRRVPCRVPGRELNRRRRGHAHGQAGFIALPDEKSREPCLVEKRSGEGSGPGWQKQRFVPRSHSDKKRPENSPWDSRTGGEPPFSDRHRYPVLPPIPTATQAAPDAPPSPTSFQNSSSTPRRRFGPPLIFNTPHHLAKGCCDQH